MIKMELSSMNRLTALNIWYICDQCYIHQGSKGSRSIEYQPCYLCKLPFVTIGFRGSGEQSLVLVNICEGHSL